MSRAGMDCGTADRFGGVSSISQNARVCPRAMSNVVLEQQANSAVSVHWLTLRKHGAMCATCGNYPHLPKRPAAGGTMQTSAFPRLLARFPLWLAALCAASATAQTVPVPTLMVDPTVSRAPISPQIYGIASYGLDTSFAQEIQVPNVRWGGDGTTRYNWMVDSSNSGFDWYFIGGNGQTTPVPGASADLMVKTYAPANALITIPIIPWVNKSAAWSCSFPVSVYGAQQSTDPYLTINGDSCGNSLTTTGMQLTDTNIPANHISNTTLPNTPPPPPAPGGGGGRPPG